MLQEKTLYLKFIEEKNALNAIVKEKKLKNNLKVSKFKKFDSIMLKYSKN